MKQIGDMMSETNARKTLRQAQQRLAAATEKAKAGKICVENGKSEVERLHGRLAELDADLLEIAVAKARGLPFTDAAVVADRQAVAAEAEAANAAVGVLAAELEVAQSDVSQRDAEVRAAAKAVVAILVESLSGEIVRCHEESKRLGTLLRAAHRAQHAVAGEPLQIAAHAVEPLPESFALPRTDDSRVAAFRQYHAALCRDADATFEPASKITAFPKAVA